MYKFIENLDLLYMNSSGKLQKKMIAFVWTWSHLSFRILSLILNLILDSTFFDTLIEKTNFLIWSKLPPPFFLLLTISFYKNLSTLVVCSIRQRTCTKMLKSKTFTCLYTLFLSSVIIIYVIEYCKGVFTFLKKIKWWKKYN